MDAARRSRSRRHTPVDPDTRPAPIAVRAPQASTGMVADRAGRPVRRRMIHTIGQFRRRDVSTSVPTAAGALTVCVAVVAGLPALGAGKRAPPIVVCR